MDIQGVSIFTASNVDVGSRVETRDKNEEEEDRDEEWKTGGRGEGSKYSRDEESRTD
jgi:hypothetical protein